LQKFQQDFNLDNNVTSGERMQALNNFGLRISLLVPFLNQNEKDYYKKGGKLDQEKMKKKMERMEKEAPKF
jgi:deoxyxylulose-5-phosphate synthase